MHDFKSSLVEYEVGLDNTVREKQAVIKDLKLQEAELKKISNQEDSLQQKVKQSRDDLLGLQFNSQNNLKAIETSKGLVLQKRLMLDKI